jgi:ribosomal-protein-alanine N-acetyltransferase
MDTETRRTETMDERMIPAGRLRERYSLGNALIRHAALVDVPAISAIERESFVDPWNAEIFFDALSYFPGTFFVAVTGGEVVGFIAGGFEDTGEQVYGHICNLAVRKDFRHQGVGKHLVARLEQQFIVGFASGVQLEVRLSNAPAQQFYRKLGYKDVFRIAEYYSNGEDAIVMMKWFR